MGMANANNNCIIYGRIISAIRFIKNRKGQEFSARFMVAVDRTYKNKETGQFVSDFIPIQINGIERMEYAHKFQQGDRVILQGSIKSEKFQGANNETVYSVFVEASSISWTQGRVQEKKQEDEKGNESSEANGVKIELSETGFNVELDFSGLPF